MSRILVALGAITLAAGPAGAADRYRDLFVFGDSLVDSGNAQTARLASGGQDPAPASQGYFQGRFSNGPNFADFLSQDLFGTNATASLQGGKNFSVGGAQFSEVQDDASPSFAEQIDAFEASTLSFSHDSLVLVTFGGNDVRREVAQLGRIPGYTPNLAPTLQAFSAGINELIGLGARNIIVTGLPDVGQIPAITGLPFPQLPPAATALSFGLNQALGVQVQALSSLTGQDIRFFDLFAYQQQIYADPAAYGLPADLDTRRACLFVPGAAPGCEGFVYFDTIHPTSQIHRAIGTGLTDLAAVPEPATWAYLILGFGALGAVLRARRVRVGFSPAPARAAVA